MDKKILNAIRKRDIRVSVEATVTQIKSYELDDEGQFVLEDCEELEEHDSHNNVLVYQHSTISLADIEQYDWDDQKEETRLALMQCGEQEYEWKRKEDQELFIHSLFSTGVLNRDEIESLLKFINLKYNIVAFVKGTEMSLDERLTHSNELVRIDAQKEYNENTTSVSP